MRSNSTVVFVLLVAVAGLTVAGPGMALPATPDAAAGASDATAQTATTNETASSTVNVSTGAQLSTVIASSDSEVRTAVETSRFELEFESGNESDRVEALGDRLETLQERSAEVNESYHEATEAYQAGEISREEYGQRLATLNVEATAINRSLSSVRSRLASLPAFTRQTAGLDDSALDNVSTNITHVVGTGPRALLQRFTGQRGGELELRHDNGLEIEAENEDGERSRELKRPGDGNSTITVAQTDALATARGALSAQQGNWTLVKASVHEEDGEHRFEFRLTGTNATGEAEVRVDGSAGTVVRVEEEIEAPEGDDDDADDDDDRDDEADDDDDRDDADDDDDRDDDGELSVLVANGSVAPNETVTLAVRNESGDRVSGVPVSQDGRLLGTTDANGTIQVALPAGGEVEITAETDDAAAELEFEFAERDDGVSGQLTGNLTVRNGSGTFTAHYGGETIENATVEVNGDVVGTTDASGSIALALASDVEDVEIELTKGEFEAETTYRLVDGDAVVVESFGGDDDSDAADDDSDETEDDDSEETDDDDSDDDETEVESGDDDSTTDGETESDSEEDDDDGSDDDSTTDDS